MKIAKVRSVKTPARGTKLSAGLDFFVPDDLPEEIILQPGDSANIPSGIHAKIPHGYALIAFNKSGIATKKDLIVGACVVDEDYQGEMHLHVMNVGKKPQAIIPGQKLVQMVLVPVSYDTCEECSLDELYPEKSERGEGGFGSTGLK